MSLNFLHSQNTKQIILLVITSTEQYSSCSLGSKSVAEENRMYRCNKLALYYGNHFWKDVGLKLSQLLAMFQILCIVDKMLILHRWRIFAYISLPEIMKWLPALRKDIV